MKRTEASQCSTFLSLTFCAPGDILLCSGAKVCLSPQGSPPPTNPPPHFNVTGIELVQSLKSPLLPQAAAIITLPLYNGDRSMATAIDSDVLIERVGATYLCKVGK